MPDVIFNCLNYLLTTGSLSPWHGDTEETAINTEELKMLQRICWFKNTRQYLFDGWTQYQAYGNHWHVMNDYGNLVPVVNP